MKKYKITTALCLMVMALTWTSCVSDDTDFSDRINNNTTPDGGGDSSDDGSDEFAYEIKEIATDLSDLDEGTETIPTEETDNESFNDYVENSSFNYTVNVAYSGSSVAISGDVDKVSVVNDGAYVTLTSAVKGVNYVLSGSSGNGAFKIYSDYKFKLTLDNLTLTSQRGAAINNQCGKSMYVVLASGSANTLSDAVSYTATPAGEDEKGAFFSEGQIIFSGGGTLDIYATGKNGIVSDDYIRFRPGNKIFVHAKAAHGVKSNDGVYISGGVLNIEVEAAGAKGINTDTFVNVDGGRTCIVSSSATSVDGTETTKGAAIKCDSTYTQTAGVVNLKTTGDGGRGLSANMTITVKGGELNVVALGGKTNATPKGITSDMDIILSAGSIYSYCANGKPVDATGGLTIGTAFTEKVHTEHFLIAKE